MSKLDAIRNFWNGTTRGTSRGSKQPRGLRRRTLSLEPLERRELLAVANITADVWTLTENPQDTGTFTIQIDGLSSGDSGNVRYRVDNIAAAATPGPDYDASDDGGSLLWGLGLEKTASFSATGSSVSINLYVETDNDATVEGDEYIQLSILGGTLNGVPNAISVGTLDSASITIIDDDAGLQPVIWVTASDRHAKEPATDVTATDTGAFEICASPHAYQNTQVYFTLLMDSDAHPANPQSPEQDYTLLVDNGSGWTPVTLAQTPGGDYTGSIVIPQGTSSKILQVRPLWDDRDEFVEIARLRIDAAAGYTVAAADEDAVAIMDADVETIPSNEERIVAGDTCGGNGSGNHNVCTCIPGLGCYGYMSDANPHPTVAVDALIQPTYGTETLEAVRVTFRMGDISQPWKTVYYDPSGVTESDLYRFAVQVDASSLGTGRYDWTMYVSQYYTGNLARTDLYEGSKNIIDASASPFGRRWGAGEYQVLMRYDNDGDAQEDDVLWMSEGNLRLFDKPGSTFTPISDPLGYWTLTGAWGSTHFVLTHADGTKDTFDKTSGVRTKSTDRSGNETTYTYSSDRLTRITYPGGRYTSLYYDVNGRLDYVLDPAGRQTDFTINSFGQITSIAMPDPDGVGGASPPTYQFQYTSDTGMMYLETDPTGIQTRYVHDSTGLLTEIQHADGTVDEWTNNLNSMFAQGLKYQRDGTGEWTNKATLTDYLASDLTAKRTHSANPTYDSEITVDRFGQPTSIIDVYGNETLILRDANGRITRLVEPDPDGGGTQAPNVTTYTYDSRGNMLTAAYADASVETWTYHATHNVATSYTFTPPSGSGEPTLRTVYTVDGTTGNVTRERQVKNLDDSVTPSDATANPDIVIDYQYTDGTETGTPPKGLLEWMRVTSHPNTPITTYEYNINGELEKVTYPDPDGGGTLRSPVLDYAWNTSGLLKGTLASVTETDAGGNYSYVTNYEYYNDGKLKKVLSPDPDGAGGLPRPVVQYTYHADGTVDTVTETTDAAGAPQLVTNYDYTNGMLTKVTYPDPDGAGALYSPVTEYVYTEGLLTSMYERSSDPAGESHLTQYVYDEMNRVRKTIYPDPDGAGTLPSPVERYYFDGAGRMYAMREETNNPADAGINTNYAYDTLGRLIEIKLPDADTVGGTNRPTTSYSYYGTGQVKTMTDAIGAVTTYAYNDLNQLIEVTLPDPDGTGTAASAVTRYQYDAGGRRTREIQTYSGTGVQQFVTQFAYDALDRITTLTAPDPDDYTSSGGSNGPLTSPVTSYGYTASGDLYWMSDPRGYVTAYVYDYLHRMTRQTKDNATIQAKTRYFYDTLGNLSLVQDPEGRNTTYEYDALHRTTKKTVDPINWDPGTGSVVLNAAGLNDAWTYQYDAFSNQKRVTDPLGHYTSYNYDYLNRLKETTLYNGADTDYAYDNRGNLASVTDPTNNTTTYTYDYLHRRRSEQTGYGTESYQYDLAGNLIWKEDRLDQITRYDRDGLGRTWRERWKNAAGTTIRTMTYTFDNFSRLTGVTDPAANYTYVYDALSRVTQITHDPDGMTPNVVVNQAYDASSNRTQMKAAVGTTNDFVNDYTLDALNRITAVTQQSQAGGNAVAAKRANLAYDASDRLTYVWRYSSLDTSEYVGRVKYITYDKAGRLTDMKYDGGGITAIDYDIRYADHLLDYVTITTSAAVTINYNYDTVDQASNLDYTGTGMPADVTYGYDHAGNRTNTGYSTGTFNRLTSDGTYNYTYDPNGNRTLRTKISDNTKTEYTWDHRNRLTCVKFKTAGGTVTKELQYSYDVYNRLVRRRIDADGAGAGGFTDTFWAYDGDNPILEFAGGTATAPSHRYLWGPAVDQILADEQVATGSPNDVRWPMTDWQGTVRDVATYNAATNVTTIANHKVYEAFGKVYSESGPTVDTIFGFTGRYFDDDAGLQWNLNRWYDPGVGRWLSEDPIGFAAGDPNLYRYVGNSPGAYVDPSGLDGAGFNPGMVQGMADHYAQQYAQNGPSAEDAFIGSLGSGLVSAALGVAEIGLVAVDTGRALGGLMSGTTPDEFRPWSEYGAYSTNRILSGATASDVRWEVGPGLAANVCTFGGYGTYQGIQEYRATGDPDAWRRAAGVQLFVAGAMRGVQECPGAVRASAGERAVCSSRVNPNEILGSDPGGLLGQKPSAPYIAEPGCMEWEFTPTRPATGPRPPVLSPGIICGNAANRVIDVPLKTRLGLVRRNVRMTLDDEIAYGEAVGEYQAILAEETRCMSSEMARQYRFQRTMEFRRQWLDNFYNTRSY